MKYIKSGGLFLILAALTCWLILREYSISQLLTALSRAELWLLLPSLLAMGCFLFCEGLNIRRVLIMLGHDVSMKQSLHYAFTGFFFSSVTPSASGGQPMQLLAMHHDHIPSSHGALALLMELTSFQIISISAALLGLLLGSCRTLVLAGQFKYLFILGILLNAGILLVLLTALFSKSLLRHLLGLCLTLSRWFSKWFSRHNSRQVSRRSSRHNSRQASRRHSRKTSRKASDRQPTDLPAPQKKDAQRRRALLRFAASYLKAARVLKTHPSVAVKLVGTTALQLLAFYSIPYFIYLSLGLSTGLTSGLSPGLSAGLSPMMPACSWLEITATEALLYVSVSALPLPGAVGAAEGGFAVLFQSIFPPTYMGCAMVLNRIISFYLPLVVSGVVLLCRRSLLASNMTPSGSMPKDPNSEMEKDG